jgi:Zn-dependent M28 family amino/carboxypeptidase
VANNLKQSRLGWLLMVSFWAMGLTACTKMALTTSAGSKTGNFVEVYQSIAMDSYKADVKAVSSDRFAGRAPASAADKLTRDYLLNAFKKVGLQPGNNGSYLQEVQMMGVSGEIVKPLKISGIDFAFKQNYVANSRKNNPNQSLQDSPLVFVGYGINAPEYQWNDYDGIDVTGKTVVILVNDPGYASQDKALFEGKTMTYYGRWTYKYEEAARQGAAGAIIIHETGAAGYGWNVIASSWTGTQFHLPQSENADLVLDIEMWINQDKTAELFKAADLSQQKLTQQAGQRGFKAVDMNLSATVVLKSKIEPSVSYNVVATLPGRTHPDEHILYMGHIDHLGQDPALEGDQIFNGAHDNGTGIAALIEIARLFGSLEQRPARSITFIGAAAEEQGTLGSGYYADNPTIALKNIVGVINMDSLNITGRKKDVRVVGFGKSGLENVLAKAASRQNRVLSRESHPERGYYYRSDHFSLAIKGVPALSAGGGNDPLNEVEAQIYQRVGAMVGRCYHQTCDEYNESWGWAGVKENLQLYFETGYLLATDNSWPNWFEGTEFKALRDKMRVN